MKVNLILDIVISRIGTIEDKRVNGEKALQCYLKSAEEGNNIGQNNLGTCYDNGIGTIKDQEKEFQWNLKLAEGGYNLKNNLGYYEEKSFQCPGCCYRDGIGTTNDEVKEFQLYLKSVEGGNSSGQNYLAIAIGNSNGKNNLGYCHSDGIGTTEGEEKAFQCYWKSAAERRNNEGQNNLGFFHQQAFQWYMKSAEGEIVMDRIDLVIVIEMGLEQQKMKRKHFCVMVNVILDIVANMEFEPQKMKRKHFKVHEISWRNIKGVNNLGYGYRIELKPQKKREGLWWYLKITEGGDGAMKDRIILGIVMVTVMVLEHQKIIKKHCSDIGAIIDDAKKWEIWRRINYSKFKNIEYLAKGGCSIWKAECIEMPEEISEFHKSSQVALRNLIIHKKSVQNF
ncbi:hypothetical protein Glove_132g110 [Diversispora epigaea]|uniref:Uncharacterized protein n=1 Tax=Diversispora epigaea TaxID=1348612 RepID=A0A397J1Z6_9GLOM|nr:hypothetical protein Glove_132g110 [Diversispora epigaea]